MISSHFEYVFLCYAADNKLMDVIEKIQNKCMRLITGAFRTNPIVSLQVQCNLPPGTIRLAYLKERFILKLYSVTTSCYVNCYIQLHSTYKNLFISLKAFLNLMFSLKDLISIALL